MLEGPQRIDQLAERVGWLDRHRRHLAIAIGMIAGPLTYLEMSSEWPRVHALAVMVATGFAVWWIGEVALAWLTAVWETEADQLARERGLPKAIVRK